MVSGPVYTILNGALRLQMGVKRVNILALSVLLANVTCNIVFVLVLRLKATGIVAANTLVSLFSCGLAVMLAWKSLRGRFTAPLLRPLIYVGIGLVPGGLSVFVLTYIDRLLLTQYVSQNDIGLYSIANKISSLPWILIGAAWTAWWPLALEMADKPDAPRQYARIFEYFIAGSMVLGLGTGLFAPDILSIFTTAPYVPAAPYALVLLMSTCPLTLTAWSTHIGLYARKRTGFISLSYFVGAAANIALNLILCPLIGVWGAVLATVLAVMASIVPLYIASQRALHVDYRWARLTVLTVVYLALVSACLFVPTFNFADSALSAPSIALKAGLLLVLVATIFVVGVISPAQVRVGLSLVGSWLAGLAARSRQV
jgi:O-antigen/teichoic acid export membrane protein